MSKTRFVRIDNRACMYRVGARATVTRPNRTIRYGKADMDLDLRLVRYFVAVAEELHFGRAAAKLYVSQPALSKQIRKLEEQLGATLLMRDSRHVTLTARGQRFLEEARQLLAIADNMQHPSRPDVVRMAHVFELETSRAVADAYVIARPDVELLEHAMDSMTQLEALLQHRLDVAILRISPRMQVDHPAGWQHCLLRLEPMVIVGRPDEPARQSLSLYERPLEVFADPPESGSYNAHGNYLTALEHDLGVTMRWIGTPGAFSHCLAHVVRSTRSSGFLEFHSYAGATPRTACRSTFRRRRSRTTRGRWRGGRRIRCPLSPICCRRLGACRSGIDGSSRRAAQWPTPGCPLTTRRSSTHSRPVVGHRPSALQHPDGSAARPVVGGPRRIPSSADEPRRAVVAIVC